MLRGQGHKYAEGACREEWGTSGQNKGFFFNEVCSEHELLSPGKGAEDRWRIPHVLDAACSGRGGGVPCALQTLFQGVMRIGFLALPCSS